MKEEQAPAPAPALYIHAVLNRDTTKEHIYCYIFFVQNQNFIKASMWSQVYAFKIH